MQDDEPTLKIPQFLIPPREDFPFPLECLWNEDDLPEVEFE